MASRTLHVLAITIFFFSMTLAADCDCWQTEEGDVFTSYTFLDFQHGQPDNYTKIFQAPEFELKPKYVSNLMSAKNMKFASNQFELSTTKANEENVQYGSEIRTNDFMLYGSFRIAMSVTGDPGAVAGFFLYRDPSAPNNEQDIELLTNETDTKRIHYTNHGNSNPSGGAEGQATVDDASTQSPWTTMSVHRTDWLPDISRFYFNGHQSSLTQYVPAKAARLHVNMWSCCGDWGGTMQPGQSATMAIKWIEMAWNKSDDVPYESAQRSLQESFGQVRDVLDQVRVKERWRGRRSGTTIEDLVAADNSPKGTGAANSRRTAADAKGAKRCCMMSGGTSYKEQGQGGNVASA